MNVNVESNSKLRVVSFKFNCKIILPFNIVKIINKICKYYINTKDDSNLNMIRQAFETSDEELKETEVEYEIQENANKEFVDIETGEIQDVKESASEENIDDTPLNDKPAF